MQGKYSNDKRSYIMVSIQIDDRDIVEEESAAVRGLHGEVVLAGRSDDHEARPAHCKVINLAKSRPPVLCERVVD